MQLNFWHLSAGVVTSFGPFSKKNIFTAVITFNVLTLVTARGWLLRAYFKPLSPSSTKVQFLLNTSIHLGPSSTKTPPKEVKSRLLWLGHQRPTPAIWSDFAPSCRRRHFHFSSSHPVPGKSHPTFIIILMPSLSSPSASRETAITIGALAIFRGKARAPLKRYVVGWSLNGTQKKVQLVG